MKRHLLKLTTAFDIAQNKLLKNKNCTQIFYNDYFFYNVYKFKIVCINTELKNGGNMATDTLKMGSQAPLFILPATDGNTYSLDSFSNMKTLVVIFSCNHCPYVQAYEDRIIEIQNDYADDLQIVAISSNEDTNYPEDSFEKMKERALFKIFNFPYLHDETQQVAKAYGATHTPEIFLFDSKRELVFHGKIDDNWQGPNSVKSKYLRNAIEELLSGKKISVPETFTIGCTIKWKK